MSTCEHNWYQHEQGGAICVNNNRADCHIVIHLRCNHCDAKGKITLDEKAIVEVKE